MRRILLLSLVLAACDRQADAPAASPPADSGGPPAAVAAGSAPAPIIETTDARHAPTRILDPRADEILRAMSTLLASTPRFAFEAEESFDEIPSRGCCSRTCAAWPSSGRTGSRPTPKEIL